MHPDLDSYTPDHEDHSCPHCIQWQRLMETMLFVDSGQDPRLHNIACCFLGSLYARDGRPPSYVMWEGSRLMIVWVDSTGTIRYVIHEDADGWPVVSTQAEVRGDTVSIQDPLPDGLMVDVPTTAGAMHRVISAEIGMGNTGGAA